MRSASLFLIFAILLMGTARTYCATPVFPQPNQVVADFSDDPERYVALNILWDTSKAKAPDAIDQRKVYYGASEGIRQKYLVMGGAASTQFEDRIRQLTADRDFRKKVLDKYQLSNLPTPPAGSAAPVRRNTDVTDDMIKGALVKSSPFMIASLLLMFFVARKMVRSASKFSAVTPPQKKPEGLPALPESLRIVKLPLLDYSVDTISAIALEKETTLHTHSVTTTTAGQVYSVGNQIHSTPGQTSTSVSTSQVDLIWVRTADSRETSWTFSGGDFKVRPGHVLSAIIVPGAKESSQFLMSFNHTTNQFKVFGTIPYGVRSGRAWSVATFIGSIGFGITVAILLSLQPDSQADTINRLLQPFVDWIMGGIASAILALIIVNRITVNLIEQRQAAFRQNYLSAFQQFLEQSTPAVQKFFAAPPVIK